MALNGNNPLVPRAARILRALTAAALLALAGACAGHKAPSPESAPAQQTQTQQPEPPPQKPAAASKGPLANRAVTPLGPETLGPAARSREVAALRKSGILKAAAPCGRPALCTRSEFGAAVGFEVELIRKIAEWGFGAKENILEQGNPGADIAAAVPCDGSGAFSGPDSQDGPRPVLAGPYLYRADTGWLCFEVLRGGEPVAEALNRILQHLYDTGTFQTVYKNWFPPEAPDIAPLTGEF